jgi:dipeptidyl aminopeptidase/acylaminoacyl peptidase
MPYGGASNSTGHVTVAEHVDVGSLDGQTRFDISENGTLAYSGIDRRRRSLAVVDVFGRSTPTGVRQQAYDSFSLARDGRRVVIDGESDLQILDLDRGTATPLVPELTRGAREDALWSPDLSRVVFGSNHEGNWEIYSKAASGIGSIEPVLRRPLDQAALSFAPDGALLMLETHPDTGADLWILPKGGAPAPWLVTSAEESDAHFSPDGQLVAYVSNSSGRSQVYVQTRASGGGRIQLSVSGGNTPRWSPEGDRVYFRQNNAMMVATVNARGALSAGPPQQLFDGGWALKGSLDFEIRSDGKSFLMILQAPEAIPTRIDLVLNWFAVLTAKMSGR